MKLYTSILTAFACNAFLFAFLMLVSTFVGCDKPAPDDALLPTVPPVMGYGNLPYYNSDDDSGLGSFTVTASRCVAGGIAEPADLVVDVYNFDPTTDPNEAIRKIAEPAPDPNDENEALQLIEPDKSFLVDIRAVDGDGKPATNYQADKTFVFRTDPFTLVVVRLTDTAGNETFSWFLTNTGTSLKTCLK